MDLVAKPTMKTSQNAKLAAFLLANPNTWHPMPMLAKLISPTGDGAGLPVHSRIANVRRMLKPEGFTIEPRREFVDGVYHSFYRLNTQP